MTEDVFRVSSDGFLPFSVDRYSDSEDPLLPVFETPLEARGIRARRDSAPRKHRLATSPSHMARDEPMPLIDVSQAAV
jgi:hypothetical protein